MGAAAGRFTFAANPGAGLSAIRSAYSSLACAEIMISAADCPVASRLPGRPETRPLPVGYWSKRHALQAAHARRPPGRRCWPRWPPSPCPLQQYPRRVEESRVVTDYRASQVHRLNLSARSRAAAIARPRHHPREGPRRRAGHCCAAATPCDLGRPLTGTGRTALRPVRHRIYLLSAKPRAPKRMNFLPLRGERDRGPARRRHRTPLRHAGFGLVADCVAAFSPRRPIPLPGPPDFGRLAAA